jgi:hypothetical protein
VSRSFPCAGECGGPEVTAADGVAFWVSTGLGITVLRTHRGPCEAQALLVHREQPVVRIPRPLSRDEKKAAAKAKKEAAG